MDSKLTLRLDKSIIDQIKVYALRHQRSVSALTEDLYKEILIEKETNGISSPIARKYKGIIGKDQISIDDIKTNYLKEKHIK